MYPLVIIALAAVAFVQGAPPRRYGESRVPILPDKGVIDGRLPIIPDKGVIDGRLPIIPDEGIIDVCPPRPCTFQFIPEECRRPQFFFHNGRRCPDCDVDICRGPVIDELGSFNRGGFRDRFDTGFLPRDRFDRRQRRRNRRRQRRRLQRGRF